MKAHPLQWPTGWPRAAMRHRAKFGKSGCGWSGGDNGTQAVYRGMQPISIDEGTRRVLNELRTFGVQDGDAIISTNLVLRLDGLPRSGQGAPSDPGVAVYWRRPGEQMKVMAIDIYDRVADNLGAVAATLNAMRAIERHGGAQILERAFTGFTALPAPEAFDPWAILEIAPRSGQDDIERAFRVLAKRHHPDNGGAADAFAKINLARRKALEQIGAA